MNLYASETSAGNLVSSLILSAVDDVITKSRNQYNRIGNWVLSNMKMGRYDYYSFDTCYSPKKKKKLFDACWFNFMYIIMLHVVSDYFDEY